MARKKKEEEKPQVIEFIDDETLCYADEATKSVVVRFDLIFDRDDIKFIDFLKIPSRAYHKSLDLIVEDYNSIIEEYPEFLQYILELRYSVLNEESSEEIEEKIDGILEDDIPFNIIRKRVEETYDLNLDARLSVNEKTSEYAIDDKKNKIILMSSSYARLFIPIIASDRELTYKLVVKILNKFSNNSKSTVQKIFKFIELRVQRTRYSDKVIWKYLESQGIDPDLEIRDLVKSITTSVLTKIAHNKNVVSYLDVVITQKIGYLFTYNYPINIKSIKSSDKEVEEKEKLEVFMLKKDSSQLLLHQLEIEKFTKDIEIEPEFEYLLEVKNPFTSKLLSIYYDGMFNTIFATDEQRVKLIIKAREDLLKCGYEIIPDILISSVDTSNKKILGKKKINDKVINSRKYTRFRIKYSNVDKIIERNNPVLQLLTIKNYDFMIGDEPLEIPPIEDLSMELLDFIG